VAAKTRVPARARRFYAEALTAAERADLPVALEIDGVDEEIAVLRLRLRTALEKSPEDLPLMLRGIELLTRAVARRYRLAKPDADQVSESLRQVLAEFPAREEVTHG